MMTKRFKAGLNILLISCKYAESDAGIPCPNRNVSKSYLSTDIKYSIDCHLLYLSLLKSFIVSSINESNML